MSLQFFTLFLSREMIRAVSWTLIHSLWQGMVLAVVAAAVVFFTKKARLASRYNLLAGALVVFVICLAVTFSLQIIGFKPATARLELPLPAVSPALHADTIASLIEDHPSITGKAISFINENAALVVFAWLLVIALRCIRLAGSLYAVHQLKRKQIFPVGEFWNGRLAGLCNQLNIHKRIQLFRSGLIKVPAAIGYFKPVILFPAALFTSLPANEIEAILLHELAHIRRKDYLVNMLQNILEIFLFFNLPLLWVSSLIRKERENCCDDIAVDQTENKRNYINALMAFGELNLQLNSSLINAFPGEKNHLMNRVKRLIYNNNQTLSNMEKKFLAAGLVVTSLFIFAFTTQMVPQKIVAKASQPIPVTASEKLLRPLALINDTLPATVVTKDKAQTIITTAKGKKYVIVSEDNRVKELHINGKKIPSEKIGDYDNITHKIMEESKLDAEQAEKEMEQSQIELVQSKLELEQSQKEFAESQKKMELDMEQSKKEFAESQKEMEKEMYLSKKELEQSKNEFAQSKKELEEAKRSMKLDMERAQKNMMEAKKEMAQSQKQMKESMIAMEMSKKDMYKSEKTREQMISDFIKENIIKEKEDLKSFKLSNDELIVNDVKQPAAMHKKFKEKYAQGKNWTMQYSN